MAARPPGELSSGRQLFEAITNTAGRG